jgi:hypothetical protein
MEQKKSIPQRVPSFFLATPPRAIPFAALKYQIWHDRRHLCEIRARLMNIKCFLYVCIRRTKVYFQLCVYVSLVSKVRRLLSSGVRRQSDFPSFQKRYIVVEIVSLRFVLRNVFEANDHFIIFLAAVKIHFPTIGCGSALKTDKRSTLTYISMYRGDRGLLKQGRVETVMISPSIWPIMN